MAYGTQRIEPRIELFLLIGVFALIGCSGSSSLRPVYPVSGKVTLKGQPVEGASIVFVPSTPDAEAATAITNSVGEYKLTTYSTGDGARPGKYNIKVFKYDIKASPPQEVRDLSYEEEQRIYKEASPGAVAPATPKNLLPKKYESETDSGLVHTVTEAPSTFDITLE